MKELLVTSINPVKKNAALIGFSRMFKTEEFRAQGFPIASGVSDQPMSEDETHQGAMNRILKARELHPGFDYWVALEGGVEMKRDEMISVVWAIVANAERIGKGKAASFIAPPEMARLINSGMEMGDADDAIFGTENSKQKNGAIGLLTKDVLTRQAIYEHAVILALIPFVNPKLYPLVSTP